jgi:hypothetical protein
MLKNSVSVSTPFINLINNNNYNFKHLDIREQFIWLMSNEDNFIIYQHFWYDTKVTFIEKWYNSKLIIVIFYVIQY